MAWKLIDRPKTVAVTRKLAKEFASMEPAPHDRPLSERRLQVYERLMRDGKFRPVTWATAACAETGGTYRVNGKHTSTMLSTLDMLPEFFVTIENYSCPTLEDVAQLYATFDSKMMSRTSSDIYLSFAATCDEIKGLPNRVITSCCVGLAYAKMSQDAYNKSQPADRAELLLEHPDFVLWYHRLLTMEGAYTDTSIGTHNRYQHLNRQSVVAAMFKTWDRDKEAALKFWLEVRDESGATPEVPTRKLAKWLLLTTVRPKGISASTSTVAEKATTREMYVKCLHAWNAWRRGEPTRLQYHAKAPIPPVS